MYRQVGAVYQRALKLVLAITLPGAEAAAILAGPIIALLYGHQYHAAAGALALLAPTIALAPASALSSQLLYAQGIRRVVTITYAVVFVENVLLNLVLIPRYSLERRRCRHLDLGAVGGKHPALLLAPAAG